MSGTLVDALLVLVFVLLGGAFAAAEIALVSLRESQVRALRERGRRGERLARLAADPNRFLAAVQVGVTLAGFFSAAFGAATLAGPLADRLVAWGVPDGLADTLAFVGDHDPDLVLLAGARRARAQAAGPAAGRGGGAGSRPARWTGSRPSSGR